MDPRIEKAGQMREIVAGLAFPGEREGSCVLLGKSRELNQTRQSFDLHLIAEEMDFDLERLVRKAISFDRFFRPDFWIGDTGHLAGDSMLQQINTEMSRGRAIRGSCRALYLNSAQFIESPGGFTFLVNQIKKYTNPKRKILHFGTGSALPGLLLELSPSRIAKSKIEDYPAIAALGFCCAELQPEIEADRERQQYADGGFGEELTWKGG